MEFISGSQFCKIRNFDKRFIGIFENAEVIDTFDVGLYLNLVEKIKVFNERLLIINLHVGIPKDILVNTQLFAVKTIDLTNNIERFYHNMDREEFDKWIVSILTTDVEKSLILFLRDLLKYQVGMKLDIFIMVK